MLIENIKNICHQSEKCPSRIKKKKKIFKNWKYLNRPTLFSAKMQLNMTISNIFPKFKTLKSNLKPAISKTIKSIKKSSGDFTQIKACLGMSDLPVKKSSFSSFIGCLFSC